MECEDAAVASMGIAAWGTAPGSVKVVLAWEARARAVKRQ
jgi:hypothetical protein